MSCVEVAAVGLHLLSWHHSGDFNNATLGAYARLDCSVQAGIFYNSEHRATVYGGYVFEDETDAFPFFALVGVGTGYDAAPIIPIAAVGVKLGDHLRLSYAPQVEVTGAHVLHLTFEFPL